MALSTRDRLFVFASPLGEDALLVHGMEAREALSQPYHVQMALVSDRPDLAPDELIGKRASLRVECQDGERFWTGVVSRFVQTGRIAAAQGEDAQLHGYGCELVPWVWHLLHHEDSRIFQALSVPDIVEAVFADFGYSDYELHLSGDHPPLPYCVQYRERNLDFIARLLEREGIHYFFRHDAETEVLVLTDNRDHAPRLDPDHVPFHATALAEDADAVTTLVRRHGTHTGRFVLRDYDFERPSADLEVAVDTMVRLPAIGSHERFVHPGGYVERDRGDALARVLMEAEEAGHETFDGEGNVRLLASGSVFALVDHPDPSRNLDYLVTSVVHRGHNNLGLGETTAYENRFTVIPHAVPYRAPATTPRPRVAGPQTAVVVGPAGEEIHTDKYGRVKVKFRWDRTPGADDRSSCWLRVAQLWAGRQWGAMFVPRIGMEVLVDFLEGDPDQPLVVGCLYNGENMPPYELPAEATKSTLKTWSSKGGEGFNEIRFEDRKDAEQLFMHAQRDMDLRVGNDRRDWTERDQSLVVKRDRLEETHRNHHAFVKKDRVSEVGADDHLAVKGKQAISIDGSLSQKVGGSVAQSFQGHSEQVATNYYLNAGANVVIEAGAMLTLKVGGSHVTLSAAGVTIVGPMVMINSGGAAASGSAGALVAPMAVLAAAVADTADPGAKPDASPLGERRPGQSPDESDHESDPDKIHWIEIVLADEAGQPVAGERVQVTLPDGSKAGGTTDETGLLRVANIDAGDCRITFPDLDEAAWEEG